MADLSDKNAEKNSIQSVLKATVKIRNLELLKKKKKKFVGDFLDIFGPKCHLFRFQNFIPTVQKGNAYCFQAGGTSKTPKTELYPLPSYQSPRKIHHV
jgi:hypothetical protein